MFDVDLSRIQYLVENYTIPCQPRLLELIEQEYKNDNPNLDEICILVADDVSLSAGIIQTVNAPAFREKSGHKEPFKNVEEAVRFLGLDRTHKIVKTLAMRDQMSGDAEARKFYRYWDSASDVAIVAAHLANTMVCADPHEAFMLGLFRDCGIPILLQAYPGYKDILREANQYPDDYQYLIRLEESKLNGINHQTVGYMVSRYWRLPEVISRAILTTHDLEPPQKMGGPQNMTFKKNVLTSLVHIAEIISLRFRRLQHANVSEERDVWPHIHEYYLGHLDIFESDLKILMEETYEMMDELLEQHRC